MISIALTGLATAGCGTGGARPPGLKGEPAAVGADLSSFYGQKAVWRPCPAHEVPAGAPERARFECATVRVPLDYGRPAGRSIDVAVNRLPARDKDKRIGSLLTNPGGPGGSGLAFVYASAADFSPEVRARYDIVGMDPRGIGKSSPVRCLSEQEGARLAKEAGEDVGMWARGFAQACAARSGRLLPFVGTDNTARDLDVVRAVLGDEKLTYYGLSYGTLLGQYYAQQFPGTTGRMVLDSVVDPTVWPNDTAAEAAAFDTALGVFVQTCLDGPDCPMGSGRAAVTKKIDDLITRLNKQAATAGDGTPVTGQDLSNGLNQTLFSEEAWPLVHKALGSAFQGDTKPLVSYLHPDGTRAGEETNGTFDAAGGLAVRCLHLRADQRTPGSVREMAAEVDKAAPVFGTTLIAGRYACTDWPAKPLPTAGRALKAEGAPEILLVQNSFDAATPAQWARSVEGQLDRARLITNASGGHGFYTKGPCTRKVVDEHLLNGTLPARGTTCHDRAPAIG
ncbi:alpha/beta hydrolase [Streptomyces sp. NPDC012888]|uniref:alpha/beta hydrolase n=1 Tax=Streptomyces sp. NPDC012888 TaxID=3364855 RepID=UPI0036B9A5DE